ncbi:hypothetical protein Trco_006675 [Trichoderma cornu-damae]|uniref:tRNA wybutosine-synthesizing protein 4 n=1 Tax=Trichoderma cornu-damae TaxID=654480 RepID=A0A9P8QL07_9HYPO|nr:hypothetical protein Trco_006675 [Trichoderma cornu-damae]
MVMGTNNSSIASKRSVERLYHSNEPPFFRYFVPKFQRRAPLINRGYWLRLRAIDVIVQKFLAKETAGRKVIINLGCGSDVLPWQCHARYNALVNNVLFIDVDYPELMQKKRAIVLKTPELRSLLGTDFTLGGEDVDDLPLRSNKYCQIGCDLRQIDRLRNSLESVIDPPECSILFVAEVSITYMDTLSADSLIKWGSTVGRGLSKRSDSYKNHPLLLSFHNHNCPIYYQCSRATTKRVIHANSQLENDFCLLEQLLPYGKTHPFARMMLSHFIKLGTPLRSIERYPTVESQTSRFKERGWPRVKIRDLWETWSSEQFVTDSERIALDDVEPFDEWEEFILFARHYFILHASTDDCNQSSLLQTPSSIVSEDQKTFSNLRVEEICRSAKKATRRRFGNSLIMNNALGQRYAVHLLGMSVNSREPTYDIFSLDGEHQPPQMPSSGPPARMCFTLTDLGEYGIMLAGGRTSPSCALSDCWLFERGANPRWRIMPRLPVPLFRHSAVRLGNSSLLLIFGGKKSSSQLSDEFFLFNPDRACWQKCEAVGSTPDSCFGATVCNAISPTCMSGTFRGILAGGISKNGRIATEQYMWQVNAYGPQPTISFAPLATKNFDSRLLSSFGAQVVHLGSSVIMCGGMGADARLQGQTITIITPYTEGLVVANFSTLNSDDECMPCMIGSSVVRDGDSLLVLGGGATCFSMGTFWETGIYKIWLPDHILGTSYSTSHLCGSSKSTIDLIGCRKFLAAPATIGLDNARSLHQNQEISMTAVPRIHLESAEQFCKIIHDGKPVIFQSCNIGQCQRKWSPEFLVSQIGTSEKFVIHECYEDTGALDFNSKNFAYVMDSFGSIMNKLQSGAKVYLRALSRKRPSETPTKLEEDFPYLAEDFALPSEMAYVKDRLFSSVLRLSGRVNMWLHYDFALSQLLANKLTRHRVLVQVMANVYAQVTGIRRMILFPPSDVKHLSFAPGASSSSIDVFQALETSGTSLHATHPQEAIIHPGDILLLPALWLHTAAPMTDMSVAVNVFFRDPEQEDHYAPGRDVYGNKDLEVYEKGRQAIARIARSLRPLPPTARGFYLSRIADELRLATEA